VTHVRKRTGYGANEIREATFERDNYTCVKCGHIPFVNGMGIYKNFDDYLNDITLSNHGKHRRTNIDTSALRCDHIDPIWDKGSEFDLKNTQTLCIKCDNEKTAGDISGGVCRYMEHKKQPLQTTIWHFRKMIVNGKNKSLATEREHT
jgi:5-methylcytosine-specific restriction endonuclease McrA